MIVMCILTLCLIIIQDKNNTAFSQSNFETKFDPIHIEANEGIEWLSDEKVYIARGEATAKQNNFQLKSDVIKALKSAEKCFQVWKKTPAWQRSYAIRKIADLMRQRKKELAKWLALEVGKPLVEGEGEVGGGADIFEWNAEETK